MSDRISVVDFEDNSLKNFYEKLSLNPASDLKKCRIKKCRVSFLDELNTELDIGPHGKTYVDVKFSDDRKCAISKLRISIEEMQCGKRGGLRVWILKDFQEKIAIILAVYKKTDEDKVLKNKKFDYNKIIDVYLELLNETI